MYLLHSPAVYDVFLFSFVLAKINLFLQRKKFLADNLGFHPSFSRHAKAKASFALVIWLNENVGFHPSFSRHAKAKASFDLAIWLNENVGFHPSFSRHAKAKASFALVIWLNENVHI